VEKHHPACGNAEENQRVDLLCAQDHIEVRARKGADPMLGDHNVARLRTERRVDFPRHPLKKLLMPLREANRVKEEIPRTDFG